MEIAAGIVESGKSACDTRFIFISNLARSLDLSSWRPNGDFVNLKVEAFIGTV